MGACAHITAARGAGAPAGAILLRLLFKCAGIFWGGDGWLAVNGLIFKEKTSFLLPVKFAQTMPRLMAPHMFFCRTVNIPLRGAGVVSQPEIPGRAWFCAAIVKGL